MDFSNNSITIKDAKTAAGNRVVPIHKVIEGLLKHLVATSEDGYVLSGLTFNKYGHRSNAIGKRFRRMKVNLNYEDRYVFHSIRKTFTTMLENAGVPENVTADIVGHEKPRITYGLYSGGTLLSIKREAISHIRYQRAPTRRFSRSAKRLSVPPNGHESS